MSARRRLDVRRLFDALAAVRAHQGLTWRDVADQTGLSPSTFTRLSDGKRPDADALCTLIAWLRIPLDRFVVEASEQASRNTRSNPSTPERTRW